MHNYTSISMLPSTKVPKYEKREVSTEQIISISTFYCFSFFLSLGQLGEWGSQLWMVQ